MAPPTSPTEAMASAALRHLLVAEALRTEWPDTAWYLVGYAPECARKATLTKTALTTTTWFKVVGHAAGNSELLDWIMALDARAEHAPVPPAVKRWDPQKRYDATGTRTAQEAASMVDACSGDALPILANAWASGRWSGAAEVA